jgi:hypothetical protein
MLTSIIYFPAIETLRPVKEMCRTVEELSERGDDVGYYRVAVPSMVFYLQRPVFEEFDADTMIRRFQGSRRVFCILSEKDYAYFIGERDQILYVLDRRPRLLTKLHLIFDDQNWVEQELILATNMPITEKSIPEGPSR